MSLFANKKECTDKAIADPQGILQVGSNFYLSQTPNTQTSRMGPVDSDETETLKKRPNTLTFNIGHAHEERSPLIEEQNHLLLPTPSPMPISSDSDTNNIAAFNTLSNLCMTPDTEDSLDCHRSSYPVIISPCMESVEEMEEYEIDDHTYLKVPMSAQPSKRETRSQHTSSDLSTPQSQSHILSHHLTHTSSPMHSSTMDSIDNLNEILGDFSSRGSTMSPDFQNNYNNNTMNNNNNTLNNLNSSSQTDLKAFPENVDFNQLIDEGENVHHKNKTVKHDENPNLITNRSGVNDKCEISNQTMEVDSALSSNVASTNHLWFTQGRSTSGNGSSVANVSTLTVHNDDNIMPFGGLSPSEYVPHHLVTQLSNTAEFADCSSQSISFHDNIQQDKIKKANSASISYSDVANNKLNRGESSTQHGKTNLVHNQVLLKENNLSEERNDEPQPIGLPQKDVYSTVAVVKSQLPQKAQPFFHAPPPPNYPPPPIQPSLYHKQQQGERQHSQELPQYYSHQQKQPQQHCEHPSTTMQPHSLNQHHPSPNTQASFIVHTPFSSEECLANHSEPPTYLDVLECCEPMELGMLNKTSTQYNTSTHNQINDQILSRNLEMNHRTGSENPINYAQICHKISNNGSSQQSKRASNQFAQKTTEMVQMTNTNGRYVDGIKTQSQNIISSPDIIRRKMLLDVRANSVATSNPSNSVGHQEFERPFVTANRINHLQDMKFNSFKGNGDTYLTACDPPYANTKKIVLPRASSRSLPPPPRPHKRQEQHHENVPQHRKQSNQRQQRIPSHKSPFLEEDEDDNGYNYIDSSKISSIVAGAGGSTFGASKSLPNETNNRNILGSPSRHPTNLMTSPSSNATSNRMRLEEQLTKVQGWCPDETDFTIEKTMEEYRCQDGYFIVWRSQEKNRFMITVSHHRVLNHFLVEEERVGKTDAIKYFVYRHGGYSSESFLDLVNHYIQSGIRQPLVDARISNKAYDVIHIPLRCPLKVKIVRKRKS